MSVGDTVLATDTWAAHHLQAEEWPLFRWADFSPLLPTGYQGWGYFMPQNIKEPNNLVPQEMCAGANYTELLNGTWGWADTNCNSKFPYICKTLRKPSRHPSRWSDALGHCEPVQS